MPLALPEEPNAFERRRCETFARVTRVAIACVCTIGLAACEILWPPAEGGDSYVQGNVFDDAIWLTIGGSEAVARQLPENIAAALTERASVETVVALLRRHGAQCEQHGRRAVCLHRKARLSGKMTATFLQHYEFEVTILPRKSGKTALTACVVVKYRECVDKEL